MDLWYDIDMKEIDVKRIGDKTEELFGRIAYRYPEMIMDAIHQAHQEETNSRACNVFSMLKENARIAVEEHIPICQDTGMAVVWLSIGQDVHLTGGDVNTAIHEAVGRSYTGNALRASVVDDPLYARKNTKNNTPALIHTRIVPGDTVTIEVMAKGFGSENKSQLKMLTPAMGVEGVKEFVVETVRKAGPDACPPYVIGVGIGGDFESCAEMSKRALLREEPQEDPQYNQLEKELLESINQLNIGPMGYGGKATALKVMVEYAPTHIAGLPCAVNICCHVCRHAKAVIE